MEPNRQKLKRARLSDQVLDRLVAMIASGDLRPGDKLPPEPQLMEQFGVGRSSVREAVGALELLGILSVRPGDGTRLLDVNEMIESRAIELSLVTIGRDSIRDLLDARRDIEQSIAKYAALRATTEDINALKSQHKSMISLTGSGRDFIVADIKFHTIIANASHNKILIRFFNELRNPICRWMEQKHKFNWGREQVIKEHESILHAIESKNAEMAHLEMSKHIENAGKKLISAIFGSQTIR